MDKQTTRHDGVKSRAFLAALGVFAATFAAATAMAWVGKLTGDQWVDVAKWLATSQGLGYGLVNVGQRVAASVASKPPQQ